MTDTDVPFRLGIVSAVTAARDSEGRVWTNHAMGRLVDMLRERCPGAKLCIPILPTRAKAMQHAVEFPPQDIIDLPPLKSVISSQRHYLATRRVLRGFAKQCDVLFIRVPFQVPTALRRLGVPKLLHVVGNPLEVVTASSDYRGLMRILAVRFGAHSNSTMRRLAHEPLTRVASNGSEMWDLLGCRDGRVVVSSCIYEREMGPRADLTLNDPPRILFVSYLRPEKGIGYLLDAFEMLRKQRPLKLTLVGGSDRVTNAEAYAHQRIRNSPYRDDITLTGMVDFGDQLFELYRSHDVFVVPSLSEGTPRTVVEARGLGCPVVATRVGGIPTSVHDGENGLLVEPADSTGLAAAIDRMLSNPELRNRLIQNGLRDSAQHTLEYFTDQLVEEVRILAELGRQSGRRRIEPPSVQPIS